jgi:hypothetical protein
MKEVPLSVYLPECLWNKFQPDRVRRQTPRLRVYLFYAYPVMPVQVRNSQERVEVMS